MKTPCARIACSRRSGWPMVLAMTLVAILQGLTRDAVAAPTSTRTTGTAVAAAAVSPTAPAGAPAAQTEAARAGWQADVPDARRLGQGKMTWFGMRLYDAALWTAAPAFDPKAPFALVLTYARDIERSRLVSSTVEELKRQGADQTSLERWTPYLERAFVDVREGDTMTGVSVPGRGVRFYANHRLTASIDDVRFAERFFAIWLARDTREPDLRRSLLGGAP
ncbi:MAG: chalcone isomerase family protein [Achromobacter sp.]